MAHDAQPTASEQHKRAVINAGPGQDSRSSRPRGCFDQPQMASHRPKIAVVVQQWLAVLDAPCADQQVDSLADGDTAFTQGTEIAGRSDCNCIAGHWRNFETP